MCRWTVFALLLVAGCHRVFGVAPAGDDTPASDAQADADDTVDAPPRCDTWFDTVGVIDSPGVPTPTAARVGYFNGDTQPDLALTSSTQAGVAIVHASPEGVFGDLAGVGTMRTGISLAVGDLDGDQDDDIAMGTANGYVVVHQLDGSASAEVEFQSGTGPVAPAFVAFDGGQQLDVAVAKRSANSIQIYMQGANALGFTPGTQFATGMGPQAIAVGELDPTNTYAEIVAANASGTSISVVSELQGQYGVTHYPVGDQPIAVAFGHVDQDDLPDLVVAKRSEQIEVIRGDGDGALALIHVVIPQGTLDDVQVSDLDGDGLGELVVLDRTRGAVYVIRDSTTTTDDDARETFAAPTDTVGIAVGDFFGGDANPDLALVLGTGQIRVYPNCR